MISRIRDYNIPDAAGNWTRTSIVFFGTKDDEFCAGLARHAKDHFLKPRWVRLLGFDEAKSTELRQKVGRIGVTNEKELAAEFWPALGPILDSGINSSIGRPVFLRYVQDRKTQGRNVEQCSVGYWFLADEGFIATIHAGRLRTAFFQDDRSDADKQSVFEASWEYLRRKWQAFERGRSGGARLRAVDSKHGQESEFIDLQAISAENWKNCPKVQGGPTIT